MMKCLRIALAALALCVSSATAQATSHMDWRNWSFDYGVPGTSGLELIHVRRNGKSVLARASLGSMRVDYEPGSCHDSPFADLISYDKLLPYEWWRVDWGRSYWSVQHNWCGDKECIRQFNVDGVEWLELGVLGTEGNYLIYQAWYLSSDGRIMARVYSKGVQCNNATHKHHPYWRFDFDVGQRDHNTVYEYNEPKGPIIYSCTDGRCGGGKLTPYSVERDAVKDITTNRMWFVKDNLTGDGVWLVPGHVNGRDDGESDAFSNRDVSARAYHEDEEKGPWPTHHDGEYELEYYGRSEGSSPEPILDSDVVLWYSAHFKHDEGPDSIPHGPLPCGDPKFPPVFDLKPGECNDVFGAGPTLFVVNSPGDRPPVTGATEQAPRSPSTGCDVAGVFPITKKRRR
jgi:hypothetical protein